AVDPRTAWAVGDKGVVIALQDGVGKWKKQSSTTTTNLNDLYFVDPHTGWIVGNDATIIATKNGGTTWTKQSVPRRPDTNPSPDLVSVHFYNASHGLAVGSSGEVLSTVDGGRNWSWRSGNTDPSPSITRADSVAYLGQDNLWAGGRGAVYI